MSLVETVRRPEYTGQNRCRPCTVVNVAFVALVGLAVGVFSVPAALVWVTVGLAAVALRGYVVPYTPQFAPHVAARLPIAFGHEDHEPDPHASLADGADDATADAPESDGEAVTAALFEAGVLVGETELRLAPAFESAWLDAVEELRAADDETLAARVADAAGFTDRATVVDGDVRVGGPAGTTLARPAAITDTATVEALADAGVPPQFWQPATRPLRLFLPECPVCAGTLQETTHAECCGGAGSVYGSLEDDVLACVDCGAVVHRFAAEEL
jgi:hypothetical protein